MADSGEKSDVKGTNILETAKEGIEGVIHNHQPKETHGRRDDIDEDTPLDEVKAPNVFERAKEEIQALVQVIHDHGKDPDQSSSKSDQSTKEELKRNEADDGVKAPNLFERAKEEVEAIIYHDKSPRDRPHRHHKETHGRSDDIDYNTPIDEVKAPNVFERAREEIEALVEAIHPKKEEPKKEPSHSVLPPAEGGFDLGASIGKSLERVCSPGKEDGFRSSIGKGLEKVCAPWGSKKD